LRISGIIWDITDKKKTEEALRESEARYKSLIESTSDWIWEVDENARFTYASPKVKDLLGYEPKEIVGRTPFDFMPPEEAGRIAEVFAANVKARAPFAGLVNVNLRKDGRPVVLETNGVPIIDAEGCFKGYRGIDRDITERTRAEETLRESEEQYRRLVQAANSVILTWDLAGNILFINDFGERFFGFGREELIGRNVIGTIVPELETSGRDLARLMQEIQKAPDRYMDNENENVTKDGTRVWVRWANKAITDQQGNLVGILSVGNDISGRKQAEEALKESQRFLETIIESAPT
jgi:PAS domain S-box-containing protein